MADTALRPGPDLLTSLAPLLREWLPRQRWFAGKGLPVTGFTPVTVTELLPPGGRLSLHHVLTHAEQGAGPGDCYQLLIAGRETLPPHLAGARIGELDGRTYYDALHDPWPAEVLLEAIRSEARVGALRFSRAPGAEIQPDLVPRLITAEQSNSSVTYGDTFILKLLRRVLPGVNPDLELPLALTREGCDRVPDPVGWIGAEVGGEAWVLGVAQKYVAGAVDGWELALQGVGKEPGEFEVWGYDDGGYDGGGAEAGSLADGVPGGVVPGSVIPEGVVPLPHRSRPVHFVEDARALGRATAEVHQALARALPTVTLGHAHLEPLVAGMVARLEAAVQAVPSLRPYETGLRTAFGALAELAAEGHTWVAQRIHGDLHLGQCLRTPTGDWLLIDFEGEPARPLAERRMPQPAVRDVAGMLRSFDYAAHSTEPPVPQWAAACRAAYCSGYAEVTGVDPRTDPVLLRAYETDKAIYEVVYEARHRPDWLPVPLSAIRRLAAHELT
ncbi:maltokinase N-terminal cap-like domain-containing protein [Streptomyces acidiscabies]|uniref:maltokinase N-terminal cap-like domain-containing protein n=1 Tax=Streptomyces acidiscabies TaxID=42234 RepID=UPI0009657431|nr:maltokinase [Streptomyces acidiscabies]GAV40732.1 maltokinase [Streptomyces acidiscabies]